MSWTGNNWPSVKRSPYCFPWSYICRSHRDHLYYRLHLRQSFCPLKALWKHRSSRSQWPDSGIHLLRCRDSWSGSGRGIFRFHDLMPYTYILPLFFPPAMLLLLPFPQQCWHWCWILSDSCLFRSFHGWPPHRQEYRKPQPSALFRLFCIYRLCLLHMPESYRFRSCQNQKFLLLPWKRLLHPFSPHNFSFWILCPHCIHGNAHP